MIYINRSRVPEPNTLIRDNSDINGERGRAIQYYENNSGIPVNFTVYQRTGVRIALNQLFRRKCAYCESIIAHVSSPHIEHFRPKGGVQEDPNHLGYYWLASEWDNLLLACGKCNDQGHKGNKFPIEYGSTYAKKSSDPIVSENPLLINPCYDDPSNHFQYSKFGGINSVSPRGRKSIEVYGLDRSMLVGERGKIAGSINRRLDDIMNLVQTCREMIEDGVPDRYIQNNGIEIDRKVKELKPYLSSWYQYSGMARFLIRTYRSQNTNDKGFLFKTQSLEDYIITWEHKEKGLAHSNIHTTV